jgi:DNA-binding NarL/FixJ family response regulator
MAGWSSLTERERAIVARVASGMTNPEIARDLYLATATVKHHVSNALAKLGARNRTELAAIALRWDDPTVREVMVGFNHAEAG